MLRRDVTTGDTPERRDPQEEWGLFPRDRGGEPEPQDGRGGGGDGCSGGAPEERQSERSDAAERPGCGQGRGSWRLGTWGSA